MSHSYLIRDATIADVYALARSLRAADRAECAGYGVTPAVGLRRSFYAASYRRTGLIDGAIAAMWGICGTALGHTAHAFLMTAPIIEKLPIAFVREARREVKTMLETHERIEGEVAVEYHAAQRFLEVLGFELGAAVDLRGGKFRPFHLDNDVGNIDTAGTRGGAADLRGIARQADCARAQHGGGNGQGPPAQHLSKALGAESHDAGDDDR